MSTLSKDLMMDSSKRLNERDVELGARGTPWEITPPMENAYGPKDQSHHAERERFEERFSKYADLLGFDVDDSKGHDTGMSDTGPSSRPPEECPDSED